MIGLLVAAGADEFAVSNNGDVALFGGADALPEGTSAIRSRAFQRALRKRRV